MKRCPQCYELHSDSDRFCERDGHELLTDPTYAAEAVMPIRAKSAQRQWLPAAAFGVLIGLIVGAGIFLPISLLSRSAPPESQTQRQASEAPTKVLPNRLATTSHTAPTPLPEESPSPDSAEAEATPSPATNTDNKTVAVQLNQGPISTGQKTKQSENEAGVQTVIEMTDGSTLDVDAAWEDKQGIWYRRSGLVSFVESSRVKAISARKGTAKPAEVQDR